MEALHDVIKAGKVRYIGASSMWAWQFATMQHTADLHGWTRFVSMQDQYNLLMREEEREMFGLLAHQGVGCIPYSPLAKGRVCRPWGERTTQMDVDPVGRRFDIDDDAPIVDARRADRRNQRCPDGTGRARVGPEESDHHCTDCGCHQTASPRRRRRSPHIAFTDGEISQLEQPYRPHTPSAF